MSSSECNGRYSLIKGFSIVHCGSRRVGDYGHLSAFVYKIDPHFAFSAMHMTNSFPLLFCSEGTMPFCFTSHHMV